MYFAIDFLKLHFKPRPVEGATQIGPDDEFWNIETKIQPLLDKLNRIHLSDDPKERDILLDEVKKEIDQIVTDFRTILKNVWERVKSGEDGFNKARRVMILIAASSAIFATIFIFASWTKSDTPTSKSIISHDQFFLKWEQMMQMHLQSCSQQDLSESSAVVKKIPLKKETECNVVCKCK